MPRIDPVQLLKCLSVLLSKNGGVKSTDEVQRLASLMNKFSKKLVSKCIYIHILKNTETDLLGLFMGAGGWTLTYGWLTDGILTHNWPLVQELIELLLVCPVNVERLKSNNCPKLVKNLSKDASDQVIRTLALTLVEQWLLIVKSATDEAPPPLTLNQVQDIRNSVETTIEEVLDLGTVEQSVEIGESDELEDPQENNFEFVSVEPETVSKNQPVSPVVEEKTKQNEALPILKISVKDGKQVVSKVKADEISKVKSDENSTSKKSDEIKIKEDRTKDKSKERRKDGGSSSSSNSSSKHSSSSKSVSSKSLKSSSSRDRSKDRERSKSSLKSGSSTKDSKHSDRHKDKESRHKDRDKRSSGSDKSKEKSKNQSEKNKETLEKLQPASLSKLGKIPKKTSTVSETDKQEPKKEKPSISIEVRKPSDANRPKTVKMFNSKFRSHGLEEEAKRPPPRGLVVNKKPPALASAPQPPKRPSPPRLLEMPPEKKPKINEHIDKPGAIKLIPPKPKPAALLESDMFVHAITASVTTKKDPKKRKRRTSASKDERSAGDSSPPPTPTDSIESPKITASAAPPRFYQDTLEPEEDKQPDKIDKIPEDDVKIDPEILEKIEEMDTTGIKSPDSPKRSPSGLKGVLIHLKRRGPKKTLRWKPEEELEEIQYFELDENERTNVTRTFTDMMHLEKCGEREAFRKRNLHNDDLMEEKIAWRPLILISGVPHIAYGNKSKEKDIQAAREKSILPALRFHQSIPDSAFEPDAESHPTTDPVVIPLEDVTGSTDNINDFRSTPWPEPKQTPAPVGPGVPMVGPPMFPPMAPFPPGFPQTPPFGMPGFPPNPAMMNPADWQNGPPAMMLPPEAMAMAPDMFPPNQMFPPNGFPMMDGMNPPMFPGRFPGPGMPVPGVPNGPPGQFNANNLNGNNRGGVRNMGPRGGQNPMWRSKGPRQWNNGPSRGGGGPLRNTVCSYFQNKGYCRTGDKCQYRHPGVNCPF